MYPVWKLKIVKATPQLTSSEMAVAKVSSFFHPMRLQELINCLTVPVQKKPLFLGNVYMYAYSQKELNRLNFKLKLTTRLIFFALLVVTSIGPLLA